MTKLYLHAGTHKTGTTAIQRFAEVNRAALLERKLLFPDLQPYRRQVQNAHHAFAHAVAGETAAISTDDARELSSRWARQAESSGAAVMLSAEPIYRHVIHDGGGGWQSARRRYLERLAEFFQPFEIEVLLVFRRPDDFVRSLFQEGVMQSTGPKWKNFAEFRKVAIPRALAYYQNTEMFADVFGKVTCFTFEEIAKSGDISRSFFEAIGVPVSGLPSPGLVRKSLTPQQTMLKLFVNRVAFAPKDNGRLLSWITSPEVSAILERSMGPGPFDIWEGREARDGFLEQMAGEIERLRQRFFPDRTSLFAASDAAELHPAVPVINNKLLASLLQQQALGEPQ